MICIDQSKPSIHHIDQCQVTARGGDRHHGQQGPADHVHVLLGRLRLSALPDNLHHAGDWQGELEGGRNCFKYCINRTSFLLPVQPAEAKKAVWHGYITAFVCSYVLN